MDSNLSPNSSLSLSKRRAGQIQSFLKRRPIIGTFSFWERSFASFRSSPGMPSAAWDFFCRSRSGQIGNDGSDAIGANTDGSTIKDRTNPPLRHNPMAPIPRPPQRLCTSLHKSRNHSVIGPDEFFVNNENSRLIQTPSSLTMRSKACGRSIGSALPKSS